MLVPLQRLTRLYDGLDQLEDMFVEGFSEEGSLIEDVFLEGGEWLDTPDVIPLLHSHLMSSHSGGGADTGRMDADAEDASISDAMDVAELDPLQIAGELPMDDTPITPQVSTTPIPYGASTPQPTSQPHEPLRDAENDDLYWKRFDILPSAPTDHAFHDRPIAQPSRAFMARLHKEYRALSTGLPGVFTLINTTDPTFLIRYQPRFSYGHTRTEAIFSVRSSSVQRTHHTKTPRSS